MKEQIVDTKPGYKTTEFWLSLVAMLLGVLMSSGVMDSVPETSIWSKIVGGAIAALAALGYTASRAKAKASNGGGS